MRKIATPQELQAELQSILAFVQHSDKPRREVIAAKLWALADRVSRRTPSFLMEWKTMDKSRRDNFVRRFTELPHMSASQREHLDDLLAKHTAFRDMADLVKNMVRDGYVPTIREPELLAAFKETELPYYSSGQPYQPPSDWAPTTQRSPVWEEAGPATVRSPSGRWARCLALFQSPLPESSE